MADALTHTQKDTTAAPPAEHIAVYELTKSITLDGDLVHSLDLITTGPVAPNVLNEVFDPDAGEETILTIHIRGFTRAK